MSLRLVGAMCILLVLASGCVSGAGDEPEAQTETATIRPTHTPQPTGTRIPTLTPIVRTPTRIPTITPTPISDMPLAAITLAFSNEFVLLVDLSSGAVYETIPIDLGGYELQLLQWNEETCELIVAGQEAAVGNVIQINLLTGIMSDIFNSTIPSSAMGYINRTAISPDHKWAAFATGDLYFEGHHPNYLGLYFASEGIGRVAGQVTSAQSDFLSLDAVDWSSANLLAFVERDSWNVYQVQTYDPVTGIRNQLSRFTIPERIIWGTTWSSDNSQILYFDSTWPTSNGFLLEDFEFGIISIEDGLTNIGTISEKKIPPLSEIKWMEWWDNDTIIVSIYSRESDSELPSGTYWLNSVDWRLESYVSNDLLYGRIFEFEDFLLSMSGSISIVNKSTGLLDRTVSLADGIDIIHDALILNGTESGGQCRP